MHRRTLLCSGLAVAGSVAGCTRFERGAQTSTPETDTTTETGTADMTDLDLREANVTDVAIEKQGDGAYRFSVELFHDDDGEDGYANWWQVETLDGGQLGRRKLRHAHSTDPFTRSETIAIPEGVDCVVVRGHDQTHGYGGQVMLVGVPDSETVTAAQGSDRQSFTESDCP